MPAPADGLPVLVIVDDDEWVRRGRAEALREGGRFREVMVLDHRTALEWEATWDDVDVVLLDAHDQSGGWDRFAGVQIAERIRERQPRERVRIVVVTGHSGNDLLRLRFAEAGADYLYTHEQVRDVASLVEALTADDEQRRMPRRATKVNAALRAIVDAGLEDAFEPGRPQKQLALSRRQVINQRRRLGGLLLGSGSMPTWRSVVELINPARGVYHRDGDDRSRP